MRLLVKRIVLTGHYPEFLVSPVLVSLLNGTMHLVVLLQSKVMLSTFMMVEMLTLLSMTLVFCNPTQNSYMMMERVE